MISLSLLLLLVNDIILSVNASSGNAGPFAGATPNGNVGAINEIQSRNGNSNPTHHIESAAVNYSPETKSAAAAAELPVTDGASALAAKYASANIVTGKLNDPNSKSAANTSSGTNNGGGGWFGKILGKSSSSEESTISTKGARDGMPPPPPPPPLQQQHQQQQDISYEPQRNTPLNQQDQSKHQQPPPQNYNSYNTYPPPYNIPNYIDPSTYQNLLYELDESTLREMTLTHQLHNLSSYVESLTSESENLLLRIDVLTERLADANANFNYVHNRNLEFEKNCTELADTIDSLKQEIAEYESKLEGAENDKKENERILVELRAELRSVTDELEQLACLVETERFESEQSDFLKNFKRKHVSKRKKRGFWAWLFGFETEDRGEEHSIEQERLRAAQEMARSTLLHALQTERASVEELEASLITVQRNNSAIMDVVQSRNSLINELNDRVAVFEEDKMVLKAALRQLQKEIREEGPKLEKAREGERRVREQLEQLKAEYEEDREMWELQFEEGEAEWNRTKEELLLIGTYVDTLEDRLATFAIAKKEIELREKQCEELEAEAKRHEKEAASWKSQVEALAKEQGETKPLLEDLVKERAQSRVKMDELRNEIKDWKQKVHEVQQQSEEIKSESARQLFLKIEESKREWEAESRRRIEDQKQNWDMIKARELQDSLEKEKVQSAEHFDQLLIRERASLEAMHRNQISQLEANIVHEWKAKLAHQKSEVESHFLNELESRLESERLKWQEKTQQQIQQRISEERAAWEASVSAQKVLQLSSLEGEVERAASKIYERLEKSGVSFGVSEPSMEPVRDLFQQTLNGFGACTGANTTEDSKETSTFESPLLNLTLQNTTFTQSLEEKPKPPSRNVPFRAIRKAFSRATGMHGLITPSTFQMRQRSRQTQGRLKKKLPAKKQTQQDNLKSQKQESAPEVSNTQASTDAEVENQVRENETDLSTSDAPTDFSNGSDENVYQLDSSWGYESEGGVELMSLMEPPPLPDFDDR